MRFPALAFLLVACFSLGAQAAPVVEDMLIEEGEATIEPKIPTTKALLFPVSASSDVPEQLTFTARSSNPNVLVRVKTGNPLLKFEIQHTGDDSAADPSYTRTAVFQLFRDLAPETVGYMGGAAQGGYFDAPETDTVRSSRIFRLYDFGPQIGQGQNSFIFQGGSPNGASTGSVGFTYDNEFHPAAIFAGRGQLAMANAGYDSFRRGTNETQYFITDGPVRELDFKHTIFGQLTHGWRVLKDLRATPRKAAPATTEPTSPIRVISSTVVQQYVKDGRTFTDAVLVLSAVAPGTSEITVTATNAAGETAERTFTVTAANEDVSLNTRPFITPLADAVIPPAGQANLGFGVLDLERDYVPLSQELVQNATPGIEASRKGISGFVRSNVLGVIGNPAYRGVTGSSSPKRYTGVLYPTVGVTQFQMGYRGDVDGPKRDVDNFSAGTVGVGESKVTPESLVIYGKPGVPLTTVPTSGAAAPTVVARFRDTDVRGQATDATAKINWGDGTALRTGSIGTDTSKPSATGFQVTGTHTYARAGIYTVVTTLTSTTGLRELIRSTVVVTASPLKAVGESLVLPGPLVANRILATFTDEQSTGVAKSYAATVDWGDGVVEPGIVRAAGLNKFVVVGKHIYRDAERYAVTVRIHKGGASAEQDALAWSTVTMSRFFGKRHLPPFDQAHLVGGITPIPVDAKVPNSPTKPTKVTVPLGTSGTQTFFTYAIQILNTGNLPSKPGMMKFYLSLDKRVNLEDEKNSAGVVVNPRDIPLVMKDLGVSQFMIQGLKPGASVQYFFEKSKYADYRLTPPLNENGTGYNLLIQLDYVDPIAQHQPIERVAVEGKINGILVSPTSINTRESGTSATFKVKLDKAPTENVTIPLAVDEKGTNEGTLDKTSLVFTPQNWNVDQGVTVTGKKDTPTTGTPTRPDGTVSYSVLLKLAVSQDPFFSGMDAPDVSVSNADRDGNIEIPTAGFSTTEAVGTNNQKSINIKLLREPTAPVSITISVSKNAEAEIVGGTPDTADPTKRVFTFLPRDPTQDPPITLTQSFTVRGKDDNLRDGNTTYTVDFAVSSDDEEYKGLRPPSITVTSVDNGTAPTAP